MVGGCPMLDAHAAPQSAPTRLWAILGPFVGHFGAILGPFWGSFLPIFGPFSGHFGAILGSFRKGMARNGPKMARKRPNDGPRWPKNSPKWAENSPKWAKNGWLVGHPGSSRGFQKNRKSADFFFFFHRLIFFFSKNSLGYYGVSGSSVPART